MLGIVILSLIVLFILIILARTILFVPKNKDSKVKEEINIDFDNAVYTLQELIKCKTISNTDSRLEDDKEFNKLVNMLPILYPNVCKNLELKKFPGRALLYHWKGINSDKPSVFMAHYDVVPVNEKTWTKPPFAAIIENGALWGRGALDTKVTVNAIMQAGEYLLKKGYTPKNDIYFAFSGGEEINGIGASEIVKYFKENNIKPEFVIDEGGAVVNGIFPGVNKASGLVGVCEKGYMNVKFTCNSNGGHASAPLPTSPVNMISKACNKVNAKPFKFYMTTPMKNMFDTLGRHSTFIYRIIFANLWCFGWILNVLCKKTGGRLNSMFRTTVAFTMMNGSDAPNVIPTEASVVANIRVISTESNKFVIERLRKIINNKNIQIEVFDDIEPGIISNSDCEEFDIIKDAIETTWDNCVCAPYMMVQNSDARSYEDICNKVYRFSATDMTDEELDTIHGNDERIRLETIKSSVEFFIRVMNKC